MEGEMEWYCYKRNGSIHNIHHNGLDETQAGIKIAVRNISNFTYTDDTILMAESEEKLKSLFMKMNEESEKVTLKLRELRSQHPYPSLHGK